MPSASGTSASTNTSPTSTARLTEQVAAKALVFVSRVQECPSGEESGPQDDKDDDDDEPRRKRAKRGAGGNPLASLARRRSVRAKVSACEPTPGDEDKAEDEVGTGSKRRKKGSPVWLELFERLNTTPCQEDITLFSY